MRSHGTVKNIQEIARHVKYSLHIYFNLIHCFNYCVVCACACAGIDLGKDIHVPFGHIRVITMCLF